MDGTQSVAAREDVLAQYYPIRASIQSVLREAVGYCRKPDFDRAAKHLDLWEQKTARGWHSFRHAVRHRPYGAESAR